MRPFGHRPPIFLCKAFQKKQTNVSVSQQGQTARNIVKDRSKGVCELNTVHWEPGDAESRGLSMETKTKRALGLEPLSSKSLGYLDKAFRSLTQWSKKKQRGSWNVLNEDLVRCVLDYLEAEDLVQLSGCNHELKTLVDEYAWEELSNSFERNVHVPDVFRTEIVQSELHLLSLTRKMYNAPAIRCGYTHTSFVSKTGHVFTWGENSTGALGQGDYVPRRVPTRIHGIEEAHSVSCGYGHTVVLLKSGKALCFGEGSPTPALVRGDILNEHIYKVAAGNRFTAFYTREGSIYVSGPGIVATTWDDGAKDFGFEFGLSIDDEDALEFAPDAFTMSAPKSDPFDLYQPRKINMGDATNSRIAFVAAGENHLVFLSTLGEVFTLGDNQYGQLGLGDTLERTVPTLVKAFKGIRIIQVSAGSRHTAVLTNEGELYTFGCAKNGKLGLELEPTTRRVLVPTKVPLRDVGGTFVGCGHEFTLILTQKKNILAFGDSSFGQLGDDSSFFTAPRPNGAFLVSLKGDQFVQIGCGGQHSAALSSSGTLYMAGNSRLLGVQGAAQRSSRPRLISIEDESDHQDQGKHRHDVGWFASQVLVKQQKGSTDVSQISLAEERSHAKEAELEKFDPFSTIHSVRAKLRRTHSF